MKLNTLRPWQNGRHFADKIFKSIFLNENVWILTNISLKFVPRGLIDNKSAIVQVMDWRWTGNKALPEAVFAKVFCKRTFVFWFKFHWNMHRRCNWQFVNIGSGTGFTPKGDKPLPEPMMTQFTDAYMPVWEGCFVWNFEGENPHKNKSDVKRRNTLGCLDLYSCNALRLWNSWDRETV